MASGREGPNPHGLISRISVFFRNPRLKIYHGFPFVYQSDTTIGVNGPTSGRRLTFKEVAKDLDLHETTVCRAIMNKYIQLPSGVVALKDFFPSAIPQNEGSKVSSTHFKRLIRDLIDTEDKKRPLSDQDISQALSKNNNLKVSRRTVAKYREEMKILSSSFRRDR